MVWLAGLNTLTAAGAPSIVRARTPCGHRDQRPRWHQAHPVPEPKAIPPTSEPLGRKLASTSWMRCLASRFRRFPHPWVADDASAATILRLSEAVDTL